MFWLQQEPAADRSVLPRGVSVRRGEVDDEYPTFEVMRRTMGQEMSWSQHAAARHHVRQTDDVSFWVAEEKQRFGGAHIVGYARSVVREGVWSLTEFFVLPAHHRLGIGGALLSHCREDGEAAGAHTFMVLASQHSAADSLYVRKLNCCPRLPMMMLVGPVSNLRPPSAGAYYVEEARPTDYEDGSSPEQDGAELLTAEPLILTEDVAREIDAMDREVVGYARPADHAFWAKEMGGPAGAARLFRRNDSSGRDGRGRLAAYAYIGPYSSGPAAAESPEMLPYCMSHVAAHAYLHIERIAEWDLDRPHEQYIALAGINEQTLRWLLECRWQIVFHYLFMSSRPLGALDRYVAHNPLYLL